MDQEAVMKNREIEKTIKADQKRAAREVKLLLLGEQFPISPLPIANSQPIILNSTPTTQFPLPLFSTHNCRG